MISGRRVWLRRARFVARKYAWLTPDRQDLFSPASSSITCRLLPTVFLHWRHENPGTGYLMAAIDVADTFLTVPQHEPTVVSCGQEYFRPGPVLPGQRDGSQMWYDSATDFLRSELGFEECPAYPYLLKTLDGRATILLHVDDMPVVCDSELFTSQLKPRFSAKYKVSIHRSN